MKVLTFMKKRKILVLVALAYIVVFIAAPQKAMQSVSNSVYYLVEMLQVIPIIFLLTVVIEAWVPKEVIMRAMGEKSGIRGNLLSLLLGSISAGPIYAAFPIGKSLLSKGASITNIVIILSAWAVIKVPMLANEAKFLGIDFMIIRWVLTVIAIIAMGYLTAIIVKKKDLPDTNAKTNKEAFEIKHEYCVGCGLCSKIAPNIYKTQNGKASITTRPSSEDSIRLVVDTVAKCPTNAIVFEAE